MSLITKIFFADGGVSLASQLQFLFQYFVARTADLQLFAIAQLNLLLLSVALYAGYFSHIHNVRPMYACKTCSWKSLFIVLHGLLLEPMSGVGGNHHIVALSLYEVDVGHINNAYLLPVANRNLVR